MEGEHMLLNGIILTCVQAIKDTRSGSAIFHLLTGKKGIQTVHDARLFELEGFYGIYPGLDKKIFTNRIDALAAKKFLHPSKRTEQAYLITPTGREWLISNQSLLPLHLFKGFSYSKMDTEFYQGILLLIQTYTNSYKQNYAFIPIVDYPNVTQSVRAIYHTNKHTSHGKMLRELHDELYQVLQKIDPLPAKLFVERLTGYKDYGLSISQLASSYNLNTIDVQLFLVAVVHHIISELKRKKSPILSQLFSYHSKGRTFITDSAAKTNELLQQGMTIEAIAKHRRLKQNTVYDHIVEIALIDTDFSIEPYVSKPVFQTIETAVHACKTLKLKTIKGAVDEQISYFQIRLSLTRIHLFQSDERGKDYDRTTNVT